MLDVKLAQQALEKTADLLDSWRIKYWIDSGTLLGAYRDKNLIPYDHDIDVRLLPGQIPEEKMPDFVKDLWGIGYRVLIQNPGKRAQVLCVDKNEVLLDLKFAFQDKNLIWIYIWQSAGCEEEPVVHAYPRRFFEKMGEIDLLGRKYPTPTPIEKYLEYHYGEWQEFKKRPEQAEETDLIWDYLKHPPCALTVKELAQKRAELGVA